MSGDPTSPEKTSQSEEPSEQALEAQPEESPAAEAAPLETASVEAKPDEAPAELPALEQAAEPMTAPAAEVEIAADARAAGEIPAVAEEQAVEAREETPLPVTVDEDGMIVAPVSAASVAADDDDDAEILDADAIVDSMTPAPVVGGEIAVAQAASDAESEDELLQKVVLPTGAKAAPLDDGADDADRTVITPMADLEQAIAATARVSMPEVRLPTPWGTPTARPLTAFRGGAGDEGVLGKLGRIAGRRVDWTVAQLAVVIAAASALGGVAVGLTRGPAPGALPSASALKASARVEVAKAAHPEIAPLPASPQVAAEPVKAAARKPSEPARAPEPEVAEVAPPVVPNADPSAGVAPDRATPRVAAKPRPAVRKPVVRTAAKPPVRQVAATTWVDPFGQ